MNYGNLARTFPRWGGNNVILWKTIMCNYYEGFITIKRLNTCAWNVVRNVWIFNPIFKKENQT